MNETIKKYLEALDRTNNNEIAFTPEEQEEFENFFKEHPEFEKMRKELLEQKVPEFRQQIADHYLADVSKYKDIEGQLKDLGFNIGGVKDVTLGNGKRMLVFFTEGSDTPTVIEYDKDKNILEELRQRQLDYKQYQGINENFNAEEMLKDIAKEKNLYVDLRPIDKYEPSQKVLNDPEKMAIISNLLKQAEAKNVNLRIEEKFAYIDEENNMIVSKTGVVLEAKVNTLTGEVNVDTPESQMEFKDESINEENVGSVEQSVITGENKEIKDEEHELDDEEEKVDKDPYETTVEQVLARYNYEVTDEKKQEIVDNLRKLANKEITMEELPEAQREFYGQCVAESQDLVTTEQETYDETSLSDNKEYERENTYTRTLRLKPNTKKKNEEGSSNYIYVAIIVLLIALAIFIYIMVR